MLNSVMVEMPVFKQNTAIFHLFQETVNKERERDQNRNQKIWFLVSTYFSLNKYGVELIYLLFTFFNSYCILDIVQDKKGGAMESNNLPKKWKCDYSLNMSVE